MFAARIAAEPGGTYKIRFPYDSLAVERIKGIPGLTWDAKGRAWRAGGLNAARIAATELASCGGKIIGTDLPLIPNEWPASDADERLRPYQRHEVGFLEAVKRGLISSTPGCGKTVVALTANREVKLVIVVAPAVAAGVWANETRKWLNREVTPLRGQTADFDRIDLHGVNVLNYSVLTWWQDALLAALEAEPDNCFIFDEAHYLANRRSKRGEAAAELAHTPHLKRLHLLTGTPARRHVTDLWALLDLIEPQGWGTFFKFARRYCHVEHDGYGWQFGDVINEEELQERERGVIYGHHLQDVVQDMPPLSRQLIPVPLDRSKSSQRYRQIVAQALQLATQGPGADINAVLHTAISAGAPHRAPKAAELARSLMEGGRRPVIFTSLRRTAKAIADKLPNFMVEHLDGGVPQAERVRRAVRASKQAQGLVATRDSLTVGIDLSGFDAVIMADPWWIPSDLVQAEGRVWRPGQDRHVDIYYLALQGTIDEVIFYRVGQRLEQLGRVLDLPPETGDLRSLVEEALDLHPDDFEGARTDLWNEEDDMPDQEEPDGGNIDLDKLLGEYFTSEDFTESTEAQAAGAVS